MSYRDDDSTGGSPDGGMGNEVDTLGPADSHCSSGQASFCTAESDGGVDGVLDAEEENEKELPVWQRMRGGGSTQSNEAGGKNSSFGGRPKSKPASPTPLPAGGGPVAGGSGKSDGSESVASGRPQRSHVSPATPYLQRPVLTIFTTADDGSGSDSENHRSGGRDDGNNNNSNNNSNLSSGLPRHGRSREHSHSRHTVDEEEDRVLRATKTSLLPVGHYSLFGNGLDQSHGRTESQRLMTNNPSPTEGRGRLTATPPDSPRAAFNAHGLSAFVETPPSSLTTVFPSQPQVSATPVVPIAPYNETATRRKVVQDMLSRYGPNAPKVAEEPIDLSAVGATRRGGEKQDSEKARRSKEREDKKQEKNRKSKSPTPAKATTLTREQVVRVGAMRLHQRLSALHLAVYRVQNDGNCQFRAMAYQLLGSEDYHDLIRDHVVSYMKKVRKEKFDIYFDSLAAADAYFEKLSKTGSWGDELSLRGASDALYINVHVLSSSELNCYSCYQPSEDAPPAPSFLVDTARIKEQRRQEQRYFQLQRQNLSQQRLPAAPPTDASLQKRTKSGRATTVHQDPSVVVGGNKPELEGPLSGAHPNSTMESSTDSSGYRPYSFLYAAPVEPEDSGKDSDAETRWNEEQVDAISIQQALQKKLEKTRIKASIPFFTPDGQLCEPRCRPISRKGSFAIPSQSAGTPRQSHQSSTQATSTPSNTTTAPASQKSSNASPPPKDTYCPPHAFPASAASCGRPTTARAPGGKGEGVTLSSPLGPDVAVCGTRANGPESHKRVMGLANFGVTANDAVNITKYQTLRKPPSRLLRPAVESPQQLQQPQQSQQPSSQQTFPVFPTVSGGNVMLLADPTTTQPGSRRSGKHSHSEAAHTRSALTQSFEALCNTYSGSSRLVPTPPPTGRSLLEPQDPSAKSYDDSDSEGEVDDNERDSSVVFVFEPRKEPIDVFLSYLYPVHYNALCIIEPDDDGGGDAGLDDKGQSSLDRETAKSSALLRAPNGAHSLGSEEKPQFIRASFLRPSL